MNAKKVADRKNSNMVSLKYQNGLSDCNYALYQCKTPNLTYSIEALERRMFSERSKSWIMYYTCCLTFNDCTAVCQYIIVYDFFVVKWLLREELHWCFTLFQKTFSKQFDKILSRPIGFVETYTWNKNVEEVFFCIAQYHRDNILSRNDM